MFTFLLNQPEVPQADARSVCLNPLPLVHDCVPQWERAFGKTTDLECHRGRALGGEACEEWVVADYSWQAAAHTIEDANALAHWVI